MTNQCAMCNDVVELLGDADLCEDCIRQIEYEAEGDDVPDLGGSWVRQLLFCILTMVRNRV